jgi:hypothetical protein
MDLNDTIEQIKNQQIQVRVSMWTKLHQDKLLHQILGLFVIHLKIKNKINLFALCATNI